MSESNNKKAYIFPGQGSQKVGMGKDIYDKYEVAQSVFKEADDVLGFSLSGLIFNGPEDELKLTLNAQPALVTMSIACYRAALAVAGNNQITAPAFLAGHSLGEYTAMTLAGVLSFADTVYLARERGRLMFEAGQEIPGAMAAVLGLEEALVNAVCQETGTWIANFNSPGQIVISGSKENIEKAIVLAKEKGAMRALPLPVSGAFHSPLMQPAVAGLSNAIAKLNFKEPQIPIIANTTAKPLTTAQDIKNELIQQLTSSVRWQQSVEYMLQYNVSAFIEIGAGNVLTGLVKRIDKAVKTLNIGNLNELTNLGL